MKKSAAKRAIAETIAITIFSVFAIAFSAQANTIKKDNKAEQALATATANAKSLTFEEVQLMDRLNAEIQIDIENLLESFAPKVCRAEVYSATGELLKTVEAGCNGLDASQIPAKAGLLMTDGGVQYYVLQD